MQSIHFSHSLRNFASDLLFHQGKLIGVSTNNSGTSWSQNMHVLNRIRYLYSFKYCSLSSISFWIWANKTSSSLEWLLACASCWARACLCTESAAFDLFVKRCSGISSVEHETQGTNVVLVWIPSIASCVNSSGNIFPPFSSLMRARRCFSRVVAIALRIGGPQMSRGSLSSCVEYAVSLSWGVCFCWWPAAEFQIEACADLDVIRLEQSGGPESN